MKRGRGTQQQVSRTSASLIEPLKRLLGRPQIYHRLEPLLYRQRFALAQLNGGVCGKDRLLDWMAECLGLAIAILLLSLLLAVLAAAPMLLVAGHLAAAGLVVSRSRELIKQVTVRRQRMLLELSELLSRLLLLVGAGEQVLRALSRCTAGKTADKQSLYAELAAALQAMQHGESMQAALAELGRRCALPEVRLFAATMLINAQRGGEAFVPSLQELTRQMWDKRKAAAKIAGEQASSKLAFPLAVIFLIIMVLVGAPAMLMM